VIDGLARPATGRCLNCGAELSGAFCAECGQRSVPANPTVAELAGDAWHELSGYDGRIASTFRGLLRPGHLTVEYLQGRRARYLPPIRLYLIVSVVYFLIAASVPITSDGNADITGPAGMRIQLTDPRSGEGLLTPERRAEMLAEIDEAPWFLQPVIREFAEDPEGFRNRLITLMPRVFFGLLPVFAAIVALFYRGRTFPTALVFATHLHAFAFIIFSVSEATKMSGVSALMVIVGLVSVVTFVTYTLRAFRKVFGGGWPMTMAKTVGIGVAYLFASVPAYILLFVWALLT
jgi:hypothetical protein